MSRVGSVAVALLFSIMCANLSALVCVVDCERQTPAPAAPSASRCHETGDSDGTQTIQASTLCERDHESVVAEPLTVPNSRSIRSLALAVIPQWDLTTPTFLVAPPGSGRAPRAAHLPRTTPLPIRV